MLCNEALILYVCSWRRQSASRHCHCWLQVGQRTLWLWQWNPRTVPASQLHDRSPWRGISPPPLATGASRQTSLASGGQTASSGGMWAQGGPSPGPSNNHYYSILPGVFPALGKHAVPFLAAHPRASLEPLTLPLRLLRVSSASFSLPGLGSVHFTQEGSTLVLVCMGWWNVGTCFCWPTYPSRCWAENHDVLGLF